MLPLGIAAKELQSGWQHIAIYYSRWRDQRGPLDTDLLHAETADLLQQLEVRAQEPAVAQLRQAAGGTLCALQQHQAFMQGLWRRNEVLMPQSDSQQGKQHLMRSREWAHHV